MKMPHKNFLDVLLFLIRGLLDIFLFNLSKLSPRDKQLWVFGTGKNPHESHKFLYLYMKKKHPEIRCVWIVKFKKHLIPTKKFCDEAYYHRTFKAIFLLLRSKVIITSYGHDSTGLFKLYGSAFVVRLFHWMHAWKIDTYDYIKKRPHTIRLFFRLLGGQGADIAAANSEEDKKILSTCRKGLIKEVLETGRPKADFFFSKIDKEKVVNSWLNYKISFSKVICYLPTHRIAEEKSSEQFLMYIRKDWDAIKMGQLLKKHNAILLIKKHPGFEMEKNLVKKKGRIVYLPTITDTNEIMMASNILITDFSTIWISYLLLNRPIIFTPYDVDHFIKVRGFYYDYYKITPGPKETTFEGVIKRIEEYLKDSKKDSELRLKRRKQFFKYYDNKNSERVTKEILKRINYKKI